MNTSPYSGLPAKAFWRTGVAERSPLSSEDLYVPRFTITKDDRIVTAGSCFAQHVGRRLRQDGYRVLDMEPLPSWVPDDVAVRFGYRLFSARYGNIYTARQLRQLFQEAFGDFEPALPVWERKGKYFDAQRPNVEPDGLDSEEMVREHRAHHLKQVKRALKNADIFVFTFGLTEAWVHKQTRTVYPTAPGTIAGEHKADVFSFENFDAFEVLEDFESVLSSLRLLNPNMKFLVTVSPVPLTATASGEHVEVATCYSKATLRAVCGILLKRHKDIDYFPSYELITSQSARGVFYEPNLRSVTAAGVKAAMDLFMHAHQTEDGPGATEPGLYRHGRSRKNQGAVKLEEVCEEVLLETFSK